MATNQRVSVEMLRQGEGSPAPLLLSLAAAGLVLVSAFGVIYSSHACRELYAQLQDLEAGQWHLQEDYSRLLLEESTWASHHRVEKVATAELAMQPPAVENLQVVAQ
ncbi:MAG: cell division protein FtsL [Halieaceae bacterium]